MKVLVISWPSEPVLFSGWSAKREKLMWARVTKGDMCSGLVIVVCDSCPSANSCALVTEVNGSPFQSSSTLESNDLHFLFFLSETGSIK